MYLGLHDAAQSREQLATAVVLMKMGTSVSASTMEVVVQELERGRESGKHPAVRPDLWETWKAACVRRGLW